MVLDFNVVQGMAHKKNSIYLCVHPKA